MYLMITAYDALDRLYVRVHVVDEDEGGVLQTKFKRTADLAMPELGERVYQDLVANVAEETLNLAYMTEPGADPEYTY